MERFILGVSVNDKLVFKYYPSRCCDDDLGRIENFVDSKGVHFCKCNECGMVWESIEDMYHPRHENIQMSEEAFQRSIKNGTQNRSWRVPSDYQAPVQKTYDEHPLPDIPDVAGLIQTILEKGKLFLQKEQRRHFTYFVGEYEKWFVLIEHDSAYILFSLNFEPHPDFLTQIRIQTIPSQHIA